MKAAIFAQLRDKIAALEKSYARKGVEGRFDHPVWVWRELQRLVIRAWQKTQMQNWGARWFYFPLGEGWDWCLRQDGRKQPKRKNSSPAFHGAKV
jgi:hypothetical protein